MHVACAADETYAPHCAAMISSVLEHDEPTQLAFHFLHPPGFSGKVKTALAGMVADRGAAIAFCEILDSEVEGLPVMDRIPRAMWYRILLPALLPELDRVLYLDADTLAVDTLAPLWDTDIDGRYVAAVTNVFEPGMVDHPRRLGLAGGETYFNSGVLLFNLDQMRSDGRTEAILACARTERLLWPDQDALNLVLGARRVSLHPRWNCMNTLYYTPEARAVFGPQAVREATASPAILHFEGPQLAKPWHYLNRHPRREEYYRQRRQTPWPEVAIEGRTWKNRALRPLPVGMTTNLLRLEGKLRRRWAQGRA